MRGEDIEGRTAARGVDGGAWISLRHAAQLLQVSYSTAWRYSRRESRLVSRQLAKGAPIYVSVESVVRYVRARGEVYAGGCCARLGDVLPFVGHAGEREHA